MGKKIFAMRGLGAAVTAFVGLIVIYISFGMIDKNVFSNQNFMNLLRSMSKYLLIGIGQSYLLITGNIDLSLPIFHGRNECHDHGDYDDFRYQSFAGYAGCIARMSGSRYS